MLCIEQSTIKHGSSFVGNLACGALCFATAAGALEFFLQFPEPCQLALSRAEEDQAVQALLGAPLRRDWLWEGHIAEHSGKVRIGVSGPLGHGFVVGALAFLPGAAGQPLQWQPLMLELHHYDEQGLRTINLLQDDERSTPADPEQMQVLAAAMHPGQGAVSPTVGDKTQVLQPTLRPEQRAEVRNKGQSPETH